MSITVLKQYFKKHEPIVINYRDYKSFDGHTFRKTLRVRLEQFESLRLEHDLKSVFMEILNTYAPMK